jgi:hypothetical protein
MQIFISNGSGGTAQFLVNGSANAIIDNEYHVMKMVFTGSALSVYVKAESQSNFTLIGSDSTGSTTTSNATNVLNFGTNGTAWKGYMKHVLVFPALSSADEAKMDNWATNEMFKQITEEDINVYLSGPAQSNYWGRGANASIAPELNGAVGGYTYYIVSNSNYTSANRGLPYWSKLAVGVNSNPDFGGETVHGFNNRFGYEMKQLNGKDVAILGYGVSGIRLAQTTSVVDWNVLSSETGDLYPRWRDFHTVWGFEDIKHVLRKNPVIRGLVCMQGEQDASLSGGGTTYRDDLENWIKTAVDRLITLGYDTTKMRVYIYRINDKFSGFDSTALANVRTAQVDVAQQNSPVNFSTYIPSKFKALTWSDTDSKAMNGDNLHYSASGLDSMGIDLFNYFKDYVNE